MTERLALVSLVLLLAAPAAAAPLAHREVLPNGIVLLVAERPAIPLVAVRGLMRAGAALDPPDRAGLASLTGAVLTRGTSTRTGPALDAAIEFVGGSLEAAAGRDSLNVSLRVLRKDLGLGLDLLADVLLSPAFPAPEVARKVAELKAAIKRSEEDPAAVASRALARLVYPGHPYGVPVEGTLESADRLTREDVQGFWRAHARPDTTVIAVVGQVTVAEARREILARLGGWQRPAAAPATVPEATPGAAPREETIARELTQATIMFGRQAIRQTNPDYFPLVVAAYVLGGGSTSRLYTRVRDQAGLEYSIYSFASPSRYGASLIVAAQTRTAEVPRVIAMVREELARMGREPVTEHEIELAKAYLIGSFPLRLDTSGKVADFVVAVEELGLGLDYADRYRARVAQVTAADVQRVARQYFAPDTFSRVVVGRSP